MNSAIRLLVPVVLIGVFGCSRPAEPPGAKARVSALDGADSVEAKFVSSLGWVVPGETFPYVIRYSAGSPATGGTVSLTLPLAAVHVESLPAHTSRTGDGTADDPYVFHFETGALPDEAVHTIVVRARAKTTTEDPQVIWKNLSAEVTFTPATREAQSSRSNGPRVTTLETARYGDRPFPIINVEYFDVTHCTGVGEPYPECTGDHSAEGLEAAVNSRTTGTSVWQLWQEISLGQLNPLGAVPTAGVDDVPFSGIGQHRFSELAPNGACTGVTNAGSDGTPLYLNRIRDGWYVLPGTQNYYGADRSGHALAGALTGQGLLFGVDDACGPTGKLVYDAASLADPDLDYNDFDTDRDGVVDFFMVIFAGDGGNGNTSVTGVNNVWPHSSDLRYYFEDDQGQTGYVSDDQLRNNLEQPLWWTDEARTQMGTADTGDALKVFVRVGPYNVNPEPAQDAISVIAHEYGHSLGLPDFYSLGGRETFGSWELMASDHAQFMTAFARQDLGWVVPEELVDGTFSLTESKVDTHEIHWREPDGTPYTLSGPDVHNAKVYRVGMPTTPVIDSVPSGTYAWYSGQGNDFGCPPTAGHGLLIQLPEMDSHQDATSVQLRFKSNYSIEWDWDYGFVLVSTDGGESWSSVPSLNGNTITDYNPNATACMTSWRHGITGVSGSGGNTQTNPNRIGNLYPEATWVDDAYDLTAFKETSNLFVLLSYFTDPAVVKPGWFIDDVQVVITDADGTQAIYESDFEAGDERTRLFSLGSAGWKRVRSDEGPEADHAYYVELRDRVSWDYDSKNQSDRGPPTWEPGLSILYTNEQHGYGNTQVDDPPAQTVVDAVPQPGSATPNLNDAAFTLATGRDRFDACTHIDNYTDAEGPGGNWKLPSGVILQVDALSGLSSSGIPAISAATATFTADVAPDCSLPPPQPPVLAFGADRTDPDDDGSYTLEWTRPEGAVGPDVLQETRVLTELFNDGAESGFGGWERSTAGTGAISWETSSGKVQSGTNAFWASGTEGALDAESVLTLRNAVGVPAAGTTALTFWSWYVAEGDDAIFVEAQADDGEWEVLHQETRSMLAPDASAAFATEPMGKYTIDLGSKYAGKALKIRFRFRVGPENRAGSTPTIGWYVDDVVIDTADWHTVATVDGSSHTLSGRAPGTFFYRARTELPFGSAATVPSPWSNVISTDVAGAGTDTDDDGILDTADNCPTTANPGQANSDPDTEGDACDACPLDEGPDGDGDGICASTDNCAADANAGQEDQDEDSLGDLCDACPADPENDPDGDQICSDEDNCAITSNPDQVDSDQDGSGDACDPTRCDDEDRDDVCDAEDNCVAAVNADQADLDQDGIGDACDETPCPDADGDGICNAVDNCAQPNADQRDHDADGVGDLCEALEFGSGGCASQAPRGIWPGAGLLLLAALLLRRRLRRALPPLLLVCAALLPYAAQSQEGAGFDLERLRLNPSAAGLLAGASPELMTPGTLRLSLTPHYQNSPLVVRRAGETLGSLVEHRWTVHLGAAYTLARKLELGLMLPVVAYQHGNDLGGVGLPLSRAAVGMPTVMARIPILEQQAGAPLSLAIDGALTVPIATARAFVLDPSVRVEPRVVAGRRFGPLLGVAHLGASLRPNVALGEQLLGSEVRLGAGAQWTEGRVRPELSLLGSLPLPLADVALAARPALEVLAGVRVPWTHGLEGYALAGPGFGNSPGVPAFRALAGLAWTPAEAAALPAPVSAPQVEAPVCVQGQPHPGALCPELDDDLDQIVNGKDGCIPDPEDLDGFEDADGCPERDNDADTLADAEDKCPLEKGPAETGGCPDADADGIANLGDRCPEVKGPAERAGCPEPDTDADGVADVQDNCRKEPGPADNQGCPKTRKQIVIIQKDRLEIREKVFFALGKAQILPASFGLLDQVASVLREHPEIPKVIVEGHTDSSGRAAVNQRLSQERAEAVKTYLIGRGVEPSRLEAKGFGPDQPIDTNDTPAGRERNRRVEFTLPAPVPPS